MRVTALTNIQHNGEFHAEGSSFDLDDAPGQLLVNDGAARLGEAPAPTATPEATQQKTDPVVDESKVEPPAPQPGQPTPVTVRKA